MNPTPRPDVSNRINQFNPHFPLSQQNGFQYTGTPVVARVNAEAQIILQQNDKVPLSQMNSHQQINQISARPDVQNVLSVEFQQPIYVRVQQQQADVSNGIKQLHQHVPLSQMNAYQNVQILSRPDVINGHVVETQQPFYMQVQNQPQGNQNNVFVPQMHNNKSQALQPQVYVPTPQTNLSRGPAHVRSSSQL